jgi:hypothetical protein
MPKAFCERIGPASVGRINRANMTIMGADGVDEPLPGNRRCTHQPPANSVFQHADAPQLAFQNRKLAPSSELETARREL